MIRDKYRLIEKKEISEGVFELKINAPEIAEAAEAGQFVNVYLSSEELLLPRPISIADASGEKLKLVYAVVGKGTTLLSKLEPGERLDLMGPLGTGFFDNSESPFKVIEESGADRIQNTNNDAEATKASTVKFGQGKDFKASSILLIGGGVGIPPLYFAARQLRKEHRGHVKIEAVLGFRDAPWYLEEFEGICDKVHVASESAELTGKLGITQGNVINILEDKGTVPLEDKGTVPLSCKGMQDSRNRPPVFSIEAKETDETKEVGDVNRHCPELALACGPKAMLKAVATWCSERAIPLRVSLEERMGCGYGVCAGCSVDTKHTGERAYSYNEIDLAASDTCVLDTSVRKKVCCDGPVFWSDDVIW